MTSHAADALLGAIGIDADYLRDGGSYYTVETHICHLDEAKAGDRLVVTTQVLGADEKRIHIFVRIMRGETLLATTEQMLLHVDTNASRAAPASAEIVAVVAALAARMRVAVPRVVVGDGAVGPSGSEVASRKCPPAWSSAPALPVLPQPTPSPARSRRDGLRGARPRRRPRPLAQARERAVVELGAEFVPSAARGAAGDARLGLALYEKGTLYGDREPRPRVPRDALLAGIARLSKRGPGRSRARSRTSAWCRR
jgi:acyl-CoA thioesterase FadM